MTKFKWLKNLFKRPIPRHVCEYVPVSVKHGMEVHGFCKCGKSCIITNFYH